MKELIGKVTFMLSKLPQKTTVHKVDLFDDTKLAYEFNCFFTNVGKNMLSKIPNAATSFTYFVNKSDFVIKTKELSIKEFKDGFYFLRGNKSRGYGDVNYNVIKIKKIFISHLKRVFFQTT